MSFSFLSHNRAVARGIAAGVALGGLWIAGRALSYFGGPALVNWRLVRTLSLLTAARHSELWPEPAAHVREAYTGMVRQSEHLIAQYVGFRLPEPLQSIHVFGRQEWVEANISNFRFMFDPLEEAYRQVWTDSTIGEAVRGFSQVFLSTQIGLLLGYLARRVLGQYDLSLLGREPITSGRLYFVQPNIVEIEQRLQLPAEQFRLWIALHETTHAYEFEGHPWVRDHMNALLTGYLASISHELVSVRAGAGPIGAMVKRVRENIFNTRYMIELMMSPEQRRLFRQLQALMCLMEGYSNHVMNAVGRHLLPQYDLLKQRFEARAKHRTPAEQLFARLTGLDLKIEQYELGERFVNFVVERGGIALMNRVWTSPWHLPSLDEIHDPERWIARMRAA
jgi:coenzyme F420 biosynthesis associated uncharacterized protein